MTAFEMQYESPFGYPPSPPWPEHDIGTQVVKFHDCDKCHSTFTSKSALKHHETLHNTVYECIWPTCSNRFTTRADFKKHIAAHTSEKFFPCAYCAKSFDNRECYHRHFREHVDKPLTSCTRCPAKFDQKATLRHHEKEHNKVRIVHFYEPHLSNLSSDLIETAVNALKNIRYEKRKLPSSLADSDCSNRSESASNTESENESCSASDNDSEDVQVQAELSVTRNRMIKKGVRFAPGTKDGDSQQSASENSVINSPVYPEVFISQPTPSKPTFEKGPSTSRKRSNPEHSNSAVSNSQPSHSKQTVEEDLPTPCKRPTPLPSRPVQPRVKNPSTSRERPTPQPSRPTQPRGRRSSTPRSAKSPMKRPLKKVTNAGLYFTRSVKKFQDEIGICLEEQVEEHVNSRRAVRKNIGTIAAQNQVKIRKFFKCSLCLYSSNNPNTYSQHLIIHSEGRKGSLTCDICQAKFNLYVSVHRHLKYCH